MESTFWRAIRHESFTRLAYRVQATEAAVFAVERGADGRRLELEPFTHVRPDDSTPEVRESALTAFKDLIGPCVAQDRDGVIEVGGPDAAGKRQYCLVLLLRESLPLPSNPIKIVLSRPRGAIAMIVRCADGEEAKARLSLLHGTEPAARS